MRMLLVFPLLFSFTAFSLQPMELSDGKELDGKPPRLRRVSLDSSENSLNPVSPFFRIGDFSGETERGTPTPKDVTSLSCLEGNPLRLSREYENSSFTRPSEKESKPCPYERVIPSLSIPSQSTSLRTLVPQDLNQSASKTPTCDEDYPDSL